MPLLHNSVQTPFCDCGLSQSHSHHHCKLTSTAYIVFKGLQGVRSVIYPKLSSSPGLILGRLPAQASPARHYMIRDKIRHLPGTGTTTKGQVSGPRVGGHVIREGSCPPQGLLHFLSLGSSSPIRKENSSKQLPTPWLGAANGFSENVSRQVMSRATEGNHHPRQDRRHRSSVTLTPGTEFTCLAR